jgi:hypothetical protein
MARGRWAQRSRRRRGDLVGKTEAEEAEVGWAGGGGRGVVGWIWMEGELE